MNELYLKQLIKDMREKSSLIVFSFGFLLVIFLAFNLLFSNLLKQNSSGKISKQAVHTQIDSDDLQQDKKDGFTVYFVLEGDSSWKIATELLGDGRRYPEIEELNKLEHNQLLDVGQILFVTVGKKINVNTNNQDTLNPEIFQKQDIFKQAKYFKNSKTANYIIKAEDSLWKIASENYSDPMVWQEIYELNKEIIGSNPDIIFPFTEINLPNII